MYQEFYQGTDEFSLRFKDHTVLSFFILYAPAIFSMLGFLAGVIMFSSPNSGGTA
jgi:hypothetical protein